jgi:RNA recognition motif-containing protein
MSEQGKIMVKNLSKKASSVFLDRMFSAYGKIIEITVNIRFDLF